MKKKLCPQCKISRFMVKNKIGEHVVVTVNEKLEIIPIYPEQSLDGFNLDILYCLGCSWKGSARSLTSKH
ncbi:MAG: hypothetical protein AUK44_08400 [Porphyromonadaceae bacterium CG2_30_38_12]|nr:MAG: hypothetical protein AUK44_08400 [Porphyromonadaceae bacterium CG2_30_38_12]